MRVSIIGQAPFGEAVLKRLLEDGIEIVAASAPEPQDGARPDPLWEAAAEAGLTPIDTAALKGAEGLTKWQAADAELGVMAFVTEMLPAQVLNTPKQGTIQYHPSLLPLHRGSSAMNWPIILGRTKTGLSIFWPDEDMDTGPILLQKQCDIGPEDTLGSLYFDKLFPMGVDAMAEAVSLVKAQDAPRIEQDHSVSTYEPPCNENHARIRWYEPAQQVYNRIRGCNPQPGSWTTMRGGERLGIFDCSLSLTNEAGMPGAVLRIQEDGIDLRLNGGVLHVKRVQPQNARKVNAGEWATEIGLQLGTRFR
ncbi:MAG: methionyl-tRNA formyltransferase [Dehalococcoidia bacterium]|nr:methionyl-tRNA formyltransferase [Dehalococcoidia bacterium]HCV00618.1 methionyl-tRNA formyltransferase [Dehalococcoidia bacterium]|tara:strand:- start:10653 stop:11573 length:921 start_codon:yes stop_codon:yes gene_type:complete